jgi:hypothetical protein
LHILRGRCGSGASRPASSGRARRIALSGGDLPLVSRTTPADVVTIRHGDSTFVEVTTIPA